MRAPTPMAGGNTGGPSMERSSFGSASAMIGSPASRTPIPATSAGSSFSRISRSSRPTAADTRRARLAAAGRGGLAARARRLRPLRKASSRSDMPRDAARLEAWYVCDRAHGSRGEPNCQSIAGGPIDEAIGELIADEMTPAAVELALEIRREIEARHDEADRLRRRAIERAQIEADLAQRRFMLVDPDNRLVADTLEREWNDKLRALANAQEERERGRAGRPVCPRRRDPRSAGRHDDGLSQRSGVIRASRTASANDCSPTSSRMSR